MGPRPRRAADNASPNIVDELTNRGVRLNIGGSIHDPTDPIGRRLGSEAGSSSATPSDVLLYFASRLMLRECLERIAGASARTALDALVQMRRIASGDDTSLVVACCGLLASILPTIVHTSPSQPTVAALLHHRVEV